LFSISQQIQKQWLSAHLSYKKPRFVSSSEAFLKTLSSMKHFIQLLSLFVLLHTFGCGGSKSSTKSNTAQTTTNAAQSEADNNKIDIAKFVGDYTVQDECNGDFGYVVKIRPGLDNSLLITGLGTFQQTVTATLVDAMQFTIVDYNNTKPGELLTVKSIGNAVRDKATGTISLQYYISDTDNIDTNCQASMVKQ
jgi:hypothetical protein